MDMEEDKFDTFDFLINDEDEVMLVFYEHEGEPKDSAIELDRENGTAILYRNKDESIMFENIEDEVFDSLEDEDNLMICELSRDENDEDTHIVYAYEAEIAD